MSQFSKVPNLTVEEYLNQEENGTIRHEYVSGQIFAMTGASEAHNLISGNLFAILHNHLGGSTCRPFINDMKVLIESANTFYYPDVMVSCEAFDAKSMFKQSPVLIAEVLSPSTTHIDRREKLLAYRQITSLREYLVIHQNRYRVEIYRRGVGNEWEYSVLGKSELLELNSLPSPVEVPVLSLYQGVFLEPLVEEDDEESQRLPNSVMIETREYRS